MAMASASDSVGNSFVCPSSSDGAAADAEAGGGGRADPPAAKEPCGAAASAGRGTGASWRGSSASSCERVRGKVNEHIRIRAKTDI
jgi:hypothetical protein